MVLPNMHVLILHQNFVDHLHPGGTRHLELARNLVESGHRCTIVAGSVDFLTGDAIQRKREIIGGVTVLRAYAPATLHHSYVGRVISYACFMITSIWAGLRAGPVDVVMGTSPPIFQLPSAWIVAVLRRCPFVLEVRDLWPEFAVDMGVLRNPHLIWIARLVEQFFYRKSSWVVANSPGFRDHLESNGVPAQRIVVVPNGVETAMFDPKSDGKGMRDRLGLAGKFVVTYAGALGKANDLNLILDAASRLKKETNIQFLLVGGGKELEWLKREILARKLDNLKLAGCFSKQEMKEVLAASDVCLATLRDIKSFRTTYPNKVFDYMAAGRPTILAIDGVIRQVIEAADGGRFVNPGDDSALSQAILDYRNNPDETRRHGQSARKHVERHFERADQARQLEAVLQAAARGTGQLKLYRGIVKRVLDFFAALFAIVMLSPLIAFVAVLVRLKLGRPVIFKQSRAGLNGRSFTLLKFRSMRDATDSSGNALPDEERLTRFGSTLRSSSLDELPQLWNILRGDMSFVGPRPLLLRYLNRYSPRQARRHEVRPGITGWAQVNGRNAIGWDEKFRLDVWYVDHCSWWVDVGILFRTILCLVTRQGVSAEDHATMTEFTGSEPSSKPPDSVVLNTRN